nr:MAG TPA: hypothetical protein [Caudoviricetes sp.]
MEADIFSSLPGKKEFCMHEKDRCGRAKGGHHGNQ